jgi:DNA-binding MarR family transcriptional regulator
MRATPTLGPLDQSIGYTLKQAASALRSAMEAELDPIGLTVTQYSCLEQLSRRPGQSNAELARGTFVTRQSMNEVLRGLEDRGFITRPSTVDHGRALPTHLTPVGSRILQSASAAVVGVEERMLGALSAADRERMLAYLKSCATALA